MTLPVAAEAAARTVDPAAVVPPAEKTRADPDRLAGLRVLLAEDSDDLAGLVDLQLRHRGATVERVAHGQAAVDRVEGETAAFDVILTDMQMPVLDGYAAVRALRDGGCALPVIALTAHAMVGDRERCLDAGCDGYTSKPVDFDVLTEELLPHVPTPVGAEHQEVAPDAPPGDLEAMLALLRREFVEALPERIRGIRSSLESRDLAAVQAAAHKLAGSSGSMGLAALGRRARELELAADGEEPSARLHGLLDRMEAEAAGS